MVSGGPTRDQARFVDGTRCVGSELAPTLPEPAATLLEYVNNRDVTHLGPRLQPYLGSLVEAPGLSPARSPAPSAPVFLLHGRDDNVIPASESQHLAARLRGDVPTRLLLTL